MKTILYPTLIFFLITLSIGFAQDIKSTLAGHDSTNGFTIVDDENNVLFRVTGEGNVGINTENPSGILDVQGGISETGKGRDVKIIAGNGAPSGNPGGDILLRSGEASFWGDAASISLGGGKPGGYGGGVNIFSGHGSEYGGDINIISSVSGLSPENFKGKFEFNSDSLRMNPMSNIKVGDINIGTDPFANMTGGKIKIYTGEDNTGGGDIEISTGKSLGGPGNKIILQTGASNGGGDIVLQSEVDGENGGNIVLIPNPNGGSVIINGSGVYSGTWSQNSDARFKRNIEPIANTVDKLQKINGVSYEYNKEEFPNKNFADGRQIGLIAQNVEEVFPELVQTDSEGYKSVAYQNLVPILIEAIKEQQKSIDDLKREITDLKQNKNSDAVKLSSTDGSGNE